MGDVGNSRPISHYCEWIALQQRRESKHIAQCVKDKIWSAYDYWTFHVGTYSMVYITLTEVAITANMLCFPVCGSTRPGLDY